MEPIQENKETQFLRPHSRKYTSEDDDLDCTQVFSLAEMYERSGGFGRYQCFVLFVQVLTMIGPSLLIANLVYFELKPTHYLCHYHNGLIQPCSLETICEGNDPNLLSWEVDTQIPYMRNIITDFGIQCESKFGIGLIGSMYFFGEAFGSLIYILLAAQLKGTRIRHIRLKNIVLMITLWGLVVVFRSLSMLYMSLFLVGLGNSIGVIQGYAYILEQMPYNKRNLTSTCTGMVDKILLCITTIILKYYESNWIYIMLPGLMCTIAASILSFFTLDSPQFHHDLGNYEKSKEIFTKFSKWNKVQPTRNYVFEKEPINQVNNNAQRNYSALNDRNLNNEHPEQFTRYESSTEDAPILANSAAARPTKLFETKIEIYQFLLCIMVFSTCILCDNILHFMLKTYDGDIYNNHLTLIISGSIAVYLSYYLINNFHPAVALTISFMILSIAGFVYPQISNLRKFLFVAPTVESLASILLCFAKLGAGCAHTLAYLFIMWQFTSKQNSFVFATCNLVARLVAVLAPEIGEFDEPIPMIIMAICAVICSILCFLVYAQIEKQQSKKPLNELSLKEINH